jgi:hypothetical protein
MRFGRILLSLLRPHARACSEPGSPPSTKSGRWSLLVGRARTLRSVRSRARRRPRRRAFRRRRSLVHRLLRLLYFPPAIIPISSVPHRRLLHVINFREYPLASNDNTGPPLRAPNHPKLPAVVLIPAELCRSRRRGMTPPAHGGLANLRRRKTTIPPRNKPPSMKAPHPCKIRAVSAPCSIMYNSRRAKEGNHKGGRRGTVEKLISCITPFISVAYISLTVT